MQNSGLTTSDCFFNFNHWPSFIANRQTVWISKAYNSRTGILPQHTLISNSIFYPLSPSLENSEYIIQTSGGLFNFYYLTNMGKIFQIGNNHQHTKNEFLPVNLPQELDNDEKITQIMFKENASILISNKQKIYVAGQNKIGELGVGPENHIHQFRRVPIQLNQDEVIVKFLTSSKDSLFKNDVSLNDHSVFFTNQNRLFVSGSNAVKELGLDRYKPCTEFEICAHNFKGETIKDIAVSNRATFVLTVMGKLWITGSYPYELKNKQFLSNHLFQPILLPNLNKGEKLIQIAAGDEHCIILTDKGRLLVSGKNSCGELGLGHRQPQMGFIFANCFLSKDEKITKVHCANHQTVIQTDKRVLFSGDFPDFTSPTRHKQSSQFKTVFYPKELYQTQLNISRLLMLMSIGCFAGAIFTEQVIHALLLFAAVSFLLPAIYIYFHGKHNKVLHQCEQNQLNEIHENLGFRY
jgi:alpha-tubulin suppressor-like RCC1 family protein